MSLSKRIVTVASQYVLFRVEAFNLLNHPNFGLPNANLAAQATFGRILSSSGAPRVLEFALRYAF